MAQTGAPCQYHEGKACGEEERNEEWSEMRNEKVRFEPGKEDIYGRTKEEIFDQFEWREPANERPSTLHFKPTILEQIDVEKWAYPQMLFPALVWYWQRVQWIDANLAIELKEVSWAELALDFQATTHHPLEIPSAQPDEATLERRARYFAAASTRAAILCNTTLARKGFTRVKESKTYHLKAVGLVQQPAYPSELNLSCIMKP